MRGRKPDSFGHLAIRASERPVRRGWRSAQSHDGDMTVHPGWRQLRSLCEVQFDFLVSGHHCRRRGRFVSAGLEIYWNATTGVRILVQYRDPFTVDVCPLREGRFPPRVDEYGGHQRIEWYDVFDALKLLTGRRPRFDVRQLYGNDPVVIAAYADALRGPCQSLLHGDAVTWDRLRRQRRARLAYWRRHLQDQHP